MPTPPSPDENIRGEQTGADIPLGTAGALALEGALLGAALTSPSQPRVRIRKRYILILILAYLGLYVAWITPIAYSLSVRVAQIDPVGKNSALALAISIPGIIVVFTSPLAGVLSDRTRSRFGRRRPWFLGGILVGLVGSTLVGIAPSIAVVVLGWSIAYIGYSISGAMVLTHLSDLLPEQQRGKVAGFSGAVTQIGPIVGIVFAGSFVHLPTLMFVVPAVVAVVFGVIFVIIMNDKKVQEIPGRIDFSALTRGFYFNPRAFPNVGWVWLSRALIFLSLSFSTTYGVYLVSQRLSVSLGDAAPVLATAGSLGIVTAIVGAVLSGFLSDRLKSRKPFLIGAAVILAIGIVVVAFMNSELQYLIGTGITTFAVGIYSAVDQAIQLDVLPREENQNGRFLSIIQLANQVPQAVGPLIAGGIIALALGEYTAVYVVGGVVAVLGALAIIPISVGRRASEPTTSVTLPN